MKDTPIFLLHGLGSHTITLLPLKKFLNYYDYKNVHSISYPVNDLSIKDSVEYVDKEIEKITPKNIEIILVGQSMGGVISNNMHTKGWKIKKAVYIGSPLHGAQLLNYLNDILPDFVVKILKKPAHDILMDKEREEEPPHDYHTISMGWFNTEFDGCVYKDETILDPENHTHLKWADHRTVFLNPRLFYHILNSIEENKNENCEKLN
jgi:pimeloyl-ACP methyl ester carboxylesterase